MDSQTTIRKLMIEELEKLQNRNARFSLRSFAKRLGLKPSETSEVISGKRRITPKLARKILSGLDEVSSSIDLESLIDSCRRLAPVIATNPSSYTQLNLDQYHLISHWYFYAILSLIETSDFREDPKWIARRLGITSQQAKDTLERLERLQYLRRDKKGRLASTGIQFTTSQDIAKASIRRSHRQHLDLARESLERDAVESRDFSGITMAIDPKKLPEAKERIQTFRRELCDFLESGAKKDVFRISIQLFPLTRNLNQEPNHES